MINTKQPDSQKRTGTILSVEKALVLVKALLETGIPTPLHVLSQMTGYPKSTAYAILSTMRDHNFITQTEDGKYALGMAFYECGQAVSRSWNIQSISKPYLEKLSYETKSTALLSIFENGTTYNIDYVSGGSDFQVVPALGKPLPAHATSQGKLLLCSMSNTQAAKYLQKNKMGIFTPQTILKEERLLKELDIIREKNYAFCEGEYLNGIRSISAPIYDNTGKMKYCLSIMTIARAITEKELFELIEATVKYAFLISRQIGFEV